VILFGEKFKNNEISKNVFEEVHSFQKKRSMSKNIRCYILVIG
jgi:hypothetical protein